MRRSDALAPLSREHHVALAVALSMRRVTAADAAQVRARALEFWRTESIEHFALEEEVLLPTLADKVGAGDEGVARVLRDHAAMRERFAALERGACAAELLHGLGAQLADHVRFEERELFGRIESLLNPAELAELERRLAPS